MLSNHNPYASEPAFPVLAHSLLPQTHTSLTSEDNGEQTTAWDLRPDIDRGFHSPSTSVFRYGTIIGFSHLRSRNPSNNVTDERTAELPRVLATSHLSQASTPLPRVYIIHSANYDGFSPQKLLESLLSTRNPPLSRNEAISRLDAVQLLPVFDFTAAVQAINEVSRALDRYYEEQRRQTPRDAVPAEPCPVLLIIAGLDSLTEGVVRASNTVRGAAVLTTVLRSLTQLVRLHRSCLSVMLVNTAGVGTVAPASPVQPAQRARADSDRPPSHEDGLYSVFRATDAPLFPSLLMRLMDQGIDSHLLISTVKGTCVIEVIKDRVGDNVGKWSVWTS
ncbi:hypothetical protein HFD88_009665 [Aspergillus terreus]|nr:hypothetical protein HFD88_009665 [Aspergillus terreus]